MKASASFSICAYLCSVGVSDREMYEIGFNRPSGCLCSNTAPSPYEDAFAYTTVSRVWSNKYKIGLVIRASLTSLKAVR